MSLKGATDLELEPELSLLPFETFAAAPLATEEPPSPEKVTPRPLLVLFEEETIDGEQGREEERKEKKKKKRRRRKKKSLDLLMPSKLSTSWECG